KLTALDSGPGQLFGSSVALTADGSVALVGSAGCCVGPGPPPGPGTAYVFTNSPTGWSQLQQLRASDGANSDRFGTAVALSGDGTTAFVGAVGKPAAYVFGGSVGDQAQQQELLAPIASFGASVAVTPDATTALVGSLSHAALVFARSGGSWSPQQGLFPDNG